MIEDGSEQVRIQCVKLMPLDELTIGYLTYKTQDHSSRVRLETYRHLKNYRQANQTLTIQ